MKRPEGSRPLRGQFVVLAFALAFVLAAVPASAAPPTPTLTRPREIPREKLPPALRDRDLSLLSSGTYAALAEAAGVLVLPDAETRAAVARDAALRAGVTLDPRVGANTVMGDDPLLLPVNMLAQAEPHIARSPANPAHLLGTFQEGRFTNGGAVSCGYAFSDDGGATWSRALIPGLTTVDGGPYDRATDPVAGYDADGDAYLCTLGLVDLGGANFDGEVLVSKSTDGGATFREFIVAASPPNPGDFLDKNWMAVEPARFGFDRPRLVVTFTNFTLSAGNPIQSVSSFDGGATWSQPVNATDLNGSVQGSQPLFLPNRDLLIAYFDFSVSDILVVSSDDGGLTYGAPVTIASVLQYNDPEARDGTFLPSVAVDPTTGTVYCTFQGRMGTTPRIFVTRSTDAGASWTPPVPVNDETPSPVPVFNPAVAAHGDHVVVAFYDKRHDPALRFLVDLYLAESFDGGETWEPNLRLTDVSTDMRLAPLTGSGFMLGDYQGVVASLGAEFPAVPIWIDTRLGTPDPFGVRISDPVSPLGGVLVR